MTSPSRPPQRTPRRLLQATRRGEVLIAAAFAMAVMVLAVGGWAVWRAGERHRATADEALMDQAGYISGMLVAGVQQQGWFATRTIMRAWNEVLQENRPWPSADSINRRALAEAIGPDMPGLSPTRFFTGDNNGWRSTDSVTRSDDVVLAHVQRRSRDTLPSPGAFRMLVVPNGADTELVFVMAAVQPKPGLYWYGFQTPLKDFRAKIVQPRIAAMAYNFKVLRDSLRQQSTAADSIPPLAIAIVAGSHDTLYTTPIRPHPPWISSRGITGGLASHVTLSVQPEAVKILMRGYPTSDVPAILGTFAFGVLLLALAARMVTRTLALSRQREEFTSSVSHELRTPLTNIQLFAETLLLDRARTPDEQRGALETITRETRRLVSMVENVLTLSRAGRPAPILIRRAERIDQLVRDVLASFDPLLRSHDIGIELIVEGAETAHVDGDAVRRILVNLLDNAVRYGPEGQTLHIKAANRNGRLELTVEDEGPGVPMADRERVWEAFERGSTTVDSGTGIGLAVVRQLVRLHGGEARFENSPRGARVFVALPGTELSSKAAT